MATMLLSTYHRRNCQILIAGVVFLLFLGCADSKSGGVVSKDSKEKPVNQSDLAEIAVINDDKIIETADLVTSILKKAGIDSFIEGSVAHSVMVRKKDSHAAIEVLSKSTQLKDKSIVYTIQ